MKALRQNLSMLNDLATKKIVKQFATKYHLVYFGHVDSQEDDHQLIRGVTASTRHTDNHYTVGSFDGHDIMLVQRRNVVTFPGKPDTEYKWLIMETNLKHGGLPHIFIDGHRHDETFYANLFVKEPKFQDFHQTLAARDPVFSAKYKVFALPHQYQEVGAVLLPELTTALVQHFPQFDFELVDDRLYVYASAHVVTVATLQEMLRASTWLASSLNALKTPG